MCLCVRLSPIELKKLLVLSFNGMLCYFPPLVVLQGNARVFRRNVDKTKVEVKARMESFLMTKAFERFHVTKVWSCMKFEDVLEVLPMLIPKDFLSLFVFIWGCE
jgi:hypothetical protein